VVRVHALGEPVWITASVRNPSVLVNPTGPQMALRVEGPGFRSGPLCRRFEGGKKSSGVHQTGG
jgi:hypothetical protein